MIAMMRLLESRKIWLLWVLDYRKVYFYPSLALLLKQHWPTQLIIMFTKYMHEFSFQNLVNALNIH